MLSRKKDPDFFLFSGKGGVGKTSISAATAVWFSEKKKKKTLIVSIDPAHSLSDSFETRIGGDIKKIAKNLYAVEIDPKKAMEEYKEKLAPQIEKMEMLRGMGIEGMFDAAGMTPGIDEIAAFDKFLHYTNSRDYDIIIFDTAPTGHALRFLSLPDVLNSWLGKMIKIRMKFSGIVNTIKKFMPFSDSSEETEIETDYLNDMKERIKSARAILSNPEKTHYNIILTPEDMSILESERSLGVLGNYDISVDMVIVNQILPLNPGCKFCTEKRKQQQERLKTINQKFGKFNVIEIPLFREEIKGMNELRKLGKLLYS